MQMAADMLVDLIRRAAHSDNHLGLIELAADGYQVQEMARIRGTTPRTIEYRLMRVRAAVRPVVDPARYPSVARTMPAQTTASGWYETAYTMRRSGLAIAQIAQTLGKSPRSVHTALRRCESLRHTG